MAPQVRRSRAQSYFLSPPPEHEAAKVAASRNNKAKKRRRMTSLLLRCASPPPRLSSLHAIAEPPAAAAAPPAVRIVRLVPPSVIRIHDPSHFASVVQRLTGIHFIPSTTSTSTSTTTTSPPPPPPSSSSSSSSSISSPLSSASCRSCVDASIYHPHSSSSNSSVQPPLAAVQNSTHLLPVDSLHSGFTNSVVVVDDSASHAAAAGSSSTGRGSRHDGVGSPAVGAASVSSPPAAAASGNPVVINASVDDGIVSSDSPTHIFPSAGTEICRPSAGTYPLIPTSGSPHRLTGHSADSTSTAAAAATRPRPDGLIGRSTAADHHRRSLTATCHNGDCGEDDADWMNLRRSGGLIRCNYNTNYEPRMDMDDSAPCCGMSSDISNCSLFKDLDLPDDCYHFCRRFEDDRHYPQLNIVGRSGDGCNINAAAADDHQIISAEDHIDYVKPAGVRYNQPIKGVDDRLELFSIPADLICAEFWENHRDE